MTDEEILKAIKRAEGTLALRPESSVESALLALRDINAELRAKHDSLVHERNVLQKICAERADTLALQDRTFDQIEKALADGALTESVLAAMRIFEARRKAMGSKGG